MNWPAYPEYRDSGVEYLGPVPTHWTVSRFSRHIGVNGGQVDPRIDPYRTMALIAPNHIESGTGKLTALETADEQGADSGKYLVRKGQLIYSKIRPNLAKAVAAPVDCLCSADMYGLSPDSSVLDSDYALRVLLSGPFTDYVIDSSMRVAMPKVNHESLGAAPVWFPPLEEQRTIVAFLEREVAKIDALIGKQEQLIATLREDRAATITQAVTKGLDPNAEMKDSGVEWMGEIPATWDVPRMSWMFSTISSGTTPDSKNVSYYDGDTNWVTTGELREGYIEETSSKVTSLALSDHSALRIYAPGSLIIAMYGATIGRLGILSAPACTNQACCVFADPVQADVRFMFYVLQAAREHLLVLASGGGQPNINQDKLRALRVPAPPMEIQRVIAEYLDTRCVKVDALIVKSTESIETLREYRSALITDAVTGKIDVRGVA